MFCDHFQLNKKLIKQVLNKQATNLETYDIYSNSTETCCPLSINTVLFSTATQGSLCLSAESELVFSSDAEEIVDKKGNTTSVSWRWFGCLKRDWSSKYHKGQCQPRCEKTKLFNQLKRYHPCNHSIIFLTYFWQHRCFLLLIISPYAPQWHHPHSFLGWFYCICRVGQLAMFSVLLVSIIWRHQTIPNKAFNAC